MPIRFESKQDVIYICPACFNTKDFVSIEHIHMVLVDGLTEQGQAQYDCEQDINDFEEVCYYCNEPAVHIPIENLTEKELELIQKMKGKGYINMFANHKEKLLALQDLVEEKGEES